MAWFGCSVAWVDVEAWDALMFGRWVQVECDILPHHTASAGLPAGNVVGHCRQRRQGELCRKLSSVGGDRRGPCPTLESL